VKAYASEPLERGLYDGTCDEAYRLGIKDALGYGVTTAMTGCSITIIFSINWLIKTCFVLIRYLDLGAGVLILWYGGVLVLDGGGNGGTPLTIGKLVTFQLYWNMMNSAYQALQGLVTSFTRSAAAAEKVFGLMDSVADIDKSTQGVVVAVNWSPIVGELRLSGVDFYYQMRPDKFVLQGMDLTIPGGTVCALVGRSGGGKSTIISVRQNQS
jgi:ATP-binding cassette subfamily B protein